MTRRLLIVLAIVTAVVALSWPRGQAQPGRKGALTLLCAAGVNDPVKTIVADYRNETGLAVDVNLGNSGALLNTLDVASTVGDLYLAGDGLHMDLAVQRGRVAEVIPIGRQHLVIAVAKGNPKNIHGLDDLTRGDVRLALTNANASAGRLAKAIFQELTLWERIEAKITVLKSQVTEIAADVSLGAVDAALVWNQMLALYPQLEGVSDTRLEARPEAIRIGVLTASRQPTAALHFARYLAATDRGLKRFADRGYQIAKGDAWEDRPRLILYSGGVNAAAIKETLIAFEQREGCRVESVFNGCGILVSQMKAVEGKPAFPDAYLACDTSYLEPVRDHFGPGTVVSETDIVMLVPGGNPKGIRLLGDLARDGLRVGLANPEQSTLGTLTRSLLRDAGVLDAVMPRVVAQTPTADMLVSQLRTGALDVVVVYRVNTTFAEGCESIPMALPGTRAMQPFAVANSSHHAQLAERLLRALRHPESRKRYEAAGFRWAGTVP